MHRKDSPWFLPMEAPTKTGLLILNVSNIILASNLVYKNRAQIGELKLKLDLKLAQKS